MSIKFERATNFTFGVWSQRRKNNPATNLNELTFDKEPITFKTAYMAKGFVIGKTEYHWALYSNDGCLLEAHFIRLKDAREAVTRAVKYIDGIEQFNNNLKRYFDNRDMGILAPLRAAVKSAAMQLPEDEVMSVWK